MGYQFKWFLDAAAAVLILISVFSAARKGFSKNIVLLVGCIVSIVLGMSLGNSLSSFIYKSSVQSSSIQKIEKHLSDEDLTLEVKSGIESLGYNVRLREEKLEEYFMKDGDLFENLYKHVNNINGRTVDTPEGFKMKLTECFADIVGGMVTDAVTPYVGDQAAKKIADDPSGFAQVLRLTTEAKADDDVSNLAAAKLIEKNYAGEASKDMIRMICFVIVAVLTIIIAAFAEHAFNSKRNESASMSEIAEKFLGAIFGLIEGMIILIVVAMAIRTLTIFGNNEMILFNRDTIDQTVFFKHIYEFSELL